MNEQRCLSEHDAKQLLSRFGVPVNREQLVDAADAAVSAADQLGYPCVLKLCGAGVAHKTELGGVKLGLLDEHAVRAAATELLELGQPDSRLLVAEQVEGNRELIAGITQDPVFGATLMFGLGGVFAEVLADVVFRLLPVGRTDVESMFEDLVNPQLLDEFRGDAPVDRDALVQALVALSDCALANSDIESVDINPFIVNSSGAVVAVDALVVLR